MGGLPNFSYIFMKPEPIGTQFKNLVDGFQGEVVWKEITDDKERMSKK